MLYTLIRLKFGGRFNPDDFNLKLALHWKPGIVTWFPCINMLFIEEDKIKLALYREGDTTLKIGHCFICNDEYDYKGVEVCLNCIVERVEA